MKNYQSIDEYIASFPKEKQELLQTVRKTIKAAAPEASEDISYGMPTFKLNGNLIHFAAFKDHLGIYPTPSGIDAFEQELKPFRSGKGTLQFPIDKPIPFGLIKKITQHRVQENLAKKNK